jgi:hypothetical protein
MIGKIRRYSREERGEFLIVHGAVDCTFRNLEAIDVDDREHSTRLCRVNVLVTVPGAISDGMRN